MLWWDTQAEKSKGALGDKRPNSERGNRSVTALKCGENGLPDKMTLSRWRKRLGTGELVPGPNGPPAGKKPKKTKGKTQSAGPKGPPVMSRS